MSGSSKLGVRQLSLECETRRSSFKKQHSVDGIHSKTDSNIRVSLSTKIKMNTDRPADRSTDRPTNRPIKVAWAESLQKSFQIENNKKPILSTTTLKGLKQMSVDLKDEVLSHKDLVDKLRRPSNDAKTNKQNINIFLSQNSNSDIDNEFFENELSLLEPVPKIMLPLQSDELDNENLKNIYQKQLLKNKQRNEKNNFTTYLPTRTDNNVISRSANSVVVIPIIKKPLIDLQEVSKPLEVVENLENHQINVIIHPSAESKRENFQKRAYSAFNGTIKNNFRTTLVRVSSVPIKADPKSKFLSPKKRIKSVKKLDIPSKDNSDVLVKVYNPADIVTMVSLVSPSGTDNEEELEPEKENIKHKQHSPIKNNSSKQDDQHKNFTLRRTVKSVSFQQSSIHAVRSFTASFPARRSSLGYTINKLNTSLPKAQEKRSPLNLCEDEQIGPKRRLVRTSSLPSELRKENIDQKIDKKNLKSSRQDSHKSSDYKKDTFPEKKSSPVVNIKVPIEIKEEIIEKNTVESENIKEKQCWEMYCKMSEKGVNIAYDTILRGMLTPTEYRLRRKLTN